MLLAINLELILYIALVIILLGLTIYFFPIIVASFIIYTKTLMRGSKDRWDRDKPSATDPESISMDNIGQDWLKENIEFETDLHIVSNGLNLYSKYYNYGYDKCAIMVSGRTESLRYGYYFAEPYKKAGYNILVLDQRGHGLSDGEINTCGFEEGKDLANWINYLKENLNVKSVVLHGICIGSASSLYAATSNDCDIIDAIIAEGMFINFSESMKNHYRERKKPVYFLDQFVNMWMKIYTGHTMHYGPINVIDKLETPLLMLHSKEDLYSKIDKANILFEKATSKNKKFVEFDKGRHSFIRINNTEKYDNEIIDFLNNL